MDDERLRLNYEVPLDSSEGILFARDLVRTLLFLFIMDVVSG